MKTIQQLCDNVQVVKETSSRFVSLLAFFSAFLAFFRG